MPLSYFSPILSFLLFFSVPVLHLMQCKVYVNSRRNVNVINVSYVMSIKNNLLLKNGSVGWDNNYILIARCHIQLHIQSSGT